LQCAVERYSLSAHADAGQIEVAVTRARPRTTVLVHGEPDTLRALAKRIARHHPHIAVNGETVMLIDAPARATSAAVSPRPTIPALAGEGVRVSLGRAEVGTQVLIRGRHRRRLTGTAMLQQGFG